MPSAKPSVLVTGVSGNLGQRLLPQLSGFRVVGVDFRPPATGPHPDEFVQLDLGEERSCGELVRVLRESGARAVVHLAFVIDPVRTGVLDVDRMWQINVVGTARVMEAIAEVNRNKGERHCGGVTQFVFLSSVSAYGPDLARPVTEEAPLEAHTLPYAIHKKGADEVVQRRAPSLGDCSVYILRPHIFAGATMQNYLVGALRGTPTGRGGIAAWLRARGRRLPMVLPRAPEYLQNKFQFVHVDDVARLIAHILSRDDAGYKLIALNVAGRGPALPLRDCALIGGTSILRLPSRAACAAALKLAWKTGLSSVPPDALPYLLGSYTMDTSRLQAFLGADYENVIRYTVRDAIADSFRVVAT